MHILVTSSSNIHIGLDHIQAIDLNTMNQAVYGFVDPGRFLNTYLEMKQQYLISFHFLTGLIQDLESEVRLECTQNALQNISSALILCHHALLMIMPHKACMSPRQMFRGWTWFFNKHSIGNMAKQCQPVFTQFSFFIKDMCKYIGKYYLPLSSSILQRLIRHRVPVQLTAEHLSRYSQPEDIINKICHMHADT